MPSSEITSQCVPLGDLLGAAGRELIERLQPDEAPDWAARIAAIDDALLRAIRRHDNERHAVADEVVQAWRRIQGSAGAVGVGELADEVGWSRRHLTERFRAEVGLAPKAYARVVRFEHARRLLQVADRPGLATVAAEAGYYDQAHLTREFQELAGCSPTRWLADEELPSVQDTPEASGAR